MYGRRPHTPDLLVDLLNTDNKKPRTLCRVSTIDGVDHDW